MPRWIWMAGLVALVACQGKDEDDAESEVVSGPAPDSCVAAADVCATYTDAWSEDEASEHCADLGGERGECPDGELGRCMLEDGLTYYLYEMPPLEAKSYCDWLLGEWESGT